MRREFVLIGSVLGFLLAIAASPAMAAVANTAHDAGTAAGEQGVCSPCHLPHTGTTGARLWPVAPTAGLAPGTTASLCASCHYATGAYQAVTAFADARATSSNVYATPSHGVQMTIADIPPGSNLAGSGMPYVAAPYTSIECTSCHNVHDDATARPFLRFDMDTICARCHNASTGTQGRQFIDGSLSTAVGDWTRATRLEAGNPGSHPVGNDITEALGDGAGDNPITFPVQFAVIKPAASAGQTLGNWSLGGHLIGGNAGGMSCNTCHAVHGLAVDAQTAGQTAYTSLDPPLGMLVVAQTPTTASNEGTGRNFANGDGLLGNTFCESCHTGPAPTGYALTRNVNPGASLGTHPVDDMTPQYNAVGSFPAAWPYSSATSGTAGNAAICESCHTPHPAAWNPASPAEGRTTLTATAGPYILRERHDLICARCHTAGIAEHHPVGVALGNGLTGAASYLTTGFPGMITTTLQCGHCHAGNGAHNWPAQGMAGLNPNWRPVNNARSAVMATDRYAASPNTVVTENVSATCVDCHLDIDATVANVSPTLHNGSSIGAETQYTNLGGGSHFIGAFSPTFFGAKSIRSTSSTINVSTEDWTTTRFGAGLASGGWSRFGGTSTAPILVCESCHDLEPDKNVTAHMLLSNFLEGQSSSLAYAAGYDDFCEACHGKPTGTHPMTADPVGRTGANLDTRTATPGRPWIAATAPIATPTGGAAGTSTWTVGDSSAGIMTCESCHQVHDAETDAGTLSLESPDLNVTGGTIAAVTSANYYGGATIARRLRQKPAAGGSAGIGTMPDVSRFCDQCHTYRQ